MSLIPAIQNDHGPMLGRLTHRRSFRHVHFCVFHVAVAAVAAAAVAAAAAAAAVAAAVAVVVATLAFVAVWPLPLPSHPLLSGPTPTKNHDKHNAIV